ncbi:hypothetical protein WJT86_06620 [Microvirga sp. W0021]|uniref:Uncharacterized protein n=1 Tax=Hohaiivirga grylli TaxID=3133970 RepID=A0ABV0BIK3_9HYPH
MTNPKDVSGETSPDTEIKKTKPASAKDGKVEAGTLTAETGKASGHFTAQPNMTFNQQVSLNSDDGQEADLSDPMARLSEIVSQVQVEPEKTLDSTVAAPEVVAGDRTAAPAPQVAEKPAKKSFWEKRKEKKLANKALQDSFKHRTAKEKRWLRRRRRVWFEELLGWIFVPLILIGIYYAALGIIALMGTTPEALISGFKLILSHF